MSKKIPSFTKGGYSGHKPSKTRKKLMLKRSEKRASIPVKSRRSEKALTTRQLTVIASVVVGMSDNDAAKAAGVCRQTVSDWRRNDPAFVKALNEQQAKEAKAIKQELCRGMKMMINGALSAIGQGIKNKDQATARWWLEKVGIDKFAKQNFDEMSDPELSPTTLASVIDEMASKRVNEFLDSKNVSPIEKLRLAHILKKREIESLRKEFDCDSD